MKLILVKISSPCWMINNLLINKAQMELIFYGHQNPLVRDVEKPEGLTIFLSLLDGTSKDVPLDIQ